MSENDPAWGSKLLALGTLTCWLWLAYHKQQTGYGWELMWTCHVASVAIVFGSALRWRRVVSASALFHLVVGALAYLADCLHNGTTTVPSALLHLLSPMAGWWALRTETSPWQAPRDASLMFLLLSLLSLWWTPPELNINLSHAPWDPLVLISSSTSVRWAAQLSAVYLVLNGGSWLINGRRRTAARSSARQATSLSHPSP